MNWATHTTTSVIQGLNVRGVGEAACALELDEGADAGEAEEVVAAGDADVVVATGRTFPT
ncbi:MAG TPA: hypothetical protein VK680_00100 [Solirubrobacteraceae bacterium]|jgi:hypothetical protein|nr:hypothetical protein [Solirubrobacteraceae bacterium]